MKLKWLFTLLAATFFISVQAAIFCPICETSKEHFWPSGKSLRRDSMCPGCRSLERHRHFWLFLQYEMKDIFEKELTVLHWAPEDCLVGKFKKLKNLLYIRGDIDRPNEPEVLKLDITKPILKDDSVDVVICNHVLEHIPDDSLAMSEMYRVLKPGGRAFIMVPLYTDLDKTYEDSSITSRTERLRHFDQEDHVRKYCQKDLVDRLKKAGFMVQSFPLSRLSDSLRKQYGMAGHDDDVSTNASRGADIFLCTKPKYW